jgi:uncharacterized cupin superfamily protein
MTDLFHDPAKYDETDPPGFRGAEIPHRAGAENAELNVRGFELPAGESLCPYHYETVEEWLLMLSGELDVRTPSGTERVSAGGLLRFPSGPAGAHRVSTPADAAGPSRFVMFSSAQEPVVAVYPDSDKIGVWVKGGADNLLVQRSGGNAQYYDGET